LLAINLELPFYNFVKRRQPIDKKPKRFVALYDAHYPHAIPAYWNPRKNSPIFNFLKDFDPQVLIDGGDALDLGIVAHWNRGKPRLTEGGRLKNVYDEYNRLLDARQKNLKSLKEWVYLEGNHEKWISDLLDEQPVFEGLVEIQTNLKLEERGAKWIVQRGHYKLGHLYFIHGDYKRGYAATYTAKAIASIYGKSVVYGHFHQNQEYSALTPFDELPYQVSGVGCLSNVNPMWRRNEPSAWTNAFCYGYVLPDGQYNLYKVNVVNNRFMVDGQLYK
jgi:hypothetical protein